MDSPVLITTKASKLTAGIKTDISIIWLVPKQCLAEGSFSGSIHNNKTNTVKGVSIVNNNTNDGKSSSKITGWVPEPGVNTLYLNSSFSFSSIFENCSAENIITTPCSIDYKKEIGLDKNQISLGIYVDQVAIDAEAVRLKIEEERARAKALADKIKADKENAAKLAAELIAAAKAINDEKYYAGQKAANSPIRTKVSLSWSKSMLRASWDKSLCRNGSASVAIYKDALHKNIIIKGNGNSNTGYLNLKAKKARSYYVKLVLSSCSNGRTYSSII